MVVTVVYDVNLFLAESRGNVLTKIMQIFANTLRIMGC